MAKNSIDVYGASGKTNVLNFEPENLHLVTDKTHPLYDERVHLPIEEGMVLNIAELGVLEPIIVWKDHETGLTCVVVGRQGSCGGWHSYRYPGASTGITETRRAAGKGSGNRAGDRWHNRP